MVRREPWRCFSYGGVEQTLMKRILGITAEYDPFHRGHAYQIGCAREQADPDAVICAMSGDFTQRGEPAVLDKWTRARIAVQHGADLVFELPFQYACSRAENFAAGAVDLLASAGATHISFGCEAERPEDLQKLAGAQMEHAREIETQVRERMKDGCSYAKARELVCQDLFGEDLTQLLLTPNNILALEYLKRMLQWEKRGVRLIPVPVRRKGSGYKSAAPSDGFAGGAAIRQMIASGQNVSDYLPYDPGDMNWTDLPAARRRLYELVRGIILRSAPDQLTRIYSLGEGMEHRMKKVIRTEDSYEGFLSAMVSRRYSAATIRRIMIYLLMDLEEEPHGAPYGRVLAAGETGRKVLRQIGAGGEGGGTDCPEDGVPALTLIANSNRTEHLQPAQLESLQLDLRAADLYNLVTGRDMDACCDARNRPWIG